MATDRNGPAPHETCAHGYRGTAISDLGYGPTDFGILTTARFYFSAFSAPERQGWIKAISTALEGFGDDRGPEVAVAVLSAVQAMRCARQSPFRFIAADWAGCSVWVTAHERAFMSTIRAAAAGRHDAARAHASLLCEGNDIRAFRAASDRLAVLVQSGRPEAEAAEIARATAD